MEFILLKNHEINLSESSNEKGGLISKSSEWFESEIEAAVTKDCNNEVLSDRLIIAVLKELMNSTEREIDEMLKIEMTFSAADLRNFSAEKDPVAVGSLKLYSKKSPNLLRILLNMFKEGNITLNLALQDFRVKIWKRDIGTANWKAEGLKMKLDAKTGHVVCSFKPVVLPRGMLVAWLNKPAIYRGTLTISVALSDSALCLLHSRNLPSGGGFETFKTALAEEVCADTQIIGVAPNQVKIKCHRIFLAAGSPVFQKMFESGMKESTGNTIEMEGISEKGIRALLAYLYYRGIKGICESSEVAVEVLQAAEKYDIKNLKEQIREICGFKPSSWFSVDAAVGLFLFSRKLSLDHCGEDVKSDQMLDSSGDETAANQFWESVKMKSLKVLKWYSKKAPKKLFESVKYQEIFKENPQLGMEVSAAFLRLA